MKLNRLPVLIRTEVTAAAKSASLPAVYSRALVALEEAVEELSFAKLKTVEISAEGLAAWAKAHQDEKLSKTARELKFRTRRTANYIAEKLVDQRRAAFVSRGGVLLNSGNNGKVVPGNEPEAGSIGSILREVGYKQGEVVNIQRAARVPDEPQFAHMSGLQLSQSLRGKGKRKLARSDVYYATFIKSSGTPLAYASWFRNNNARGIARQITDPTEIEKARQIITLTKAWCDEFLKNLPRNVSKAKVSK